MLLKIRHALLEISNHPSIIQSAIIFNNEIVITSGCILTPYVCPIDKCHEDETGVNARANTKIIKKLQQCQLINAQDESTDEGQFLNTLTCHVMFGNSQKNVIFTGARKPHILSRYRAKILYLFSTVDISRYFHKFLNSTSSIGELENNEILRSSFLVLTISPNRGKESFERFLLHIGHYLRYFYPVNTLDDVLSICTPFGLEIFYNTISIGKVANVIGHKSSLFILSNSLPLGCEGSAVFNNKMRLVGIIISTSFTFQCENVSLTLVANFAILLLDFLKHLGVEQISFTVPRQSSKFPWEMAMVVIESGGSQGTGTFVKVHHKKFILTCSHLVFEANSKVVCRSIDCEFQSEVLWYNPQYNQPFDVALLVASDSIPDWYCVRLSSIKPHLGQIVFNAGFPRFVNVNLKYDFNPSIYQGRIIKCTAGTIISDGCVQAGQSGGPMFDEHGRILGICVSNMKIDNFVYPNVNTAVPICRIRKAIEKFAKTNDLATLNGLVTNLETTKTPYLQSKL